jgi:ABC-type glycerol-3-phosphate transport system substrate-binding protein
MTRFALLAALVLAALPAAATAQPPGVRFATAGASGDTLTLSETVVVPVAKTVVVTVEINGKAVEQNQTVTTYEAQQIERKLTLKDAKVTDGRGKAVAADKLAERLKTPAAVVVVTVPLPPEHRKLFKDDTLFLDLSPAPAEPPKGK